MYRKLHNKWNSSLFARRNGCRVPEIYWRGKNPKEIPFSTLPEKFVIKPVFYGGSGRNVYVISEGRDLMRNRIYNPEELQRELDKNMSRAKIHRARLPLLAQEFVSEAANEIEISHEFKMYVFAEKICAIQVVKRISNKIARVSWYSRKWEIFQEPMQIDQSSESYEPPPCYLASLLSDASRVGAIDIHHFPST